MPIEIKRLLTGEILRTVGSDTLVGADLRMAHLSLACLWNADLRRARLADGLLICADLSGAYLAGATADRANFGSASCCGADFSGASLRKASFHLADLMGAKFVGADLTGVYLSGASVRGIELAGATVDKDYVVASDNQYHFIVNLAPEYRDGHWGSTLELYKCTTGWFARRGRWSGSPETVLSMTAKSVNDDAFTERLKAVLEVFCT